MDTQNRKLLLVDDDEAILDYLTAKLSKHFVIVSTTDPAHACKMARDERPDVILCDIDMPDMTGGDVAAELAADPATARIPLIYLTALVSQQEARELQGKVGGRPGVSKQAPIAELLAKIAEVAR